MISTNNSFVFGHLLIFLFIIEHHSLLITKTYEGCTFLFCRFLLYNLVQLAFVFGHVLNLKDWEVLHVHIHIHAY